MKVLCLYKNATEYGLLEVWTPSEIVVNGEIEWKITFTPSKSGIKAGGSMKILFPPYQHQRSQEYVQVNDYWKPHYLYANSDHDHIRFHTEVEKVASAFSHIKRWPDSSRVAIITFKDDVAEGEPIYIHYGGIHRPWLRGEASPTRVGQFAHHREGTYLKHKIEIDPDGKGDFYEIQGFPDIRIIPDKPEYIGLTAPSKVKKGETFTVYLQVFDRFNNPIFQYQSDSFVLAIYDMKNNRLIKELTYGQHLTSCNGYQVELEEEGFYEITITNNQHLRVEKAVLLCDKSNDKIYWGDLHLHSNLTANIRDNDGGASPKAGYTYASEVSRLDYLCMSEQTFEFDDDNRVNIDGFTWEKIGEEADNYYKEGILTTFPGFELHSKRGDTIVLFPNSLSQYAYPSGIKDIDNVWEFYKDKEHMTIPHFHRYCGGRPSKDQQEQQHAGFQIENWQLDSQSERLAEVFSSQWGRFETATNPMLLKAKANVKGNSLVDHLNLGKKWGITASSDGHDGKPGYGAITAVYAKENSRKSIYEGLYKRKTYATTHPRVFLEFNIDDLEMGDVANLSKYKIKNRKDELNKERMIIDNRTIKIRALAPDTIAKIEIIKNGQTWHKRIINQQWLEYDYMDMEAIDVDTYYYIRLTLDNGHIVWSSPIWLET